MTSTLEHLPGAPPEARRHRFSVPEYLVMVESGVFGPDDRLELVDGEVVDKVGVGSQHAAVVARLTRVLVRAAGDALVVFPQNPLVLSASVPEPDVTLLRGRDDDYSGDLPRVPDALLVVEVGDTSALADRRSKVPRYAADGVGEVWLVNLVAGVVERYRQPSGDGYRDVTEHREETLVPDLAPDVAVDVGDLLR